MLIGSTAGARHVTRLVAPAVCFSFCLANAQRPLCDVALELVVVYNFPVGRSHLEYHSTLPQVPA